MTVEQRVSDGVCVLALRGRVTGEDFDCLFDALDHCRASEHQLIVLELSEVPWIDSSGLGLLLAAFSQSHKRGIRLALAAPNSRLREIFRVGKLPFEVHPSEGEAVLALKGAPQGG